MSMPGAGRVIGRPWLMLLLAPVFVLCACTADLLEQKRAESAALLDTLVADDAPGCSIAVAIDREVVWAGARGVANLDTGTRLQTTTPIHIASAGKQFTAMAVLMLAEQGLLSLEDSVADHLDGMPAWAEDLTLDDLMHHTSGIADFDVLPVSTFGEPPVTNDDILEFVRTNPDAQPGTPGTWRYSNTNYTLLADIVAEATGIGFTEWMQANVFTPLELDARIGPQTPDDPVGYAAAGDAFIVAEPLPWDMVGPGFVTMTASDLARWGDEFRAPSLVSTETLDAALHDGPLVEEGWSYGPGVYVADDGAVGHEGSGGGHETNFGVSPDRHATAAILCNHDGLHLGTVMDELAEVWIG